MWSHVFTEPGNVFLKHGKTMWDILLGMHGTWVCMAVPCIQFLIWQMSTILPLTMMYLCKNFLMILVRSHWFLDETLPEVLKWFFSLLRYLCEVHGHVEVCRIETNACILNALAPSMTWFLQNEYFCFKCCRAIKCLKHTANADF